MKKTYTPPLARFDSLKASESVAATCWAYSVNQQTHLYMWTYTCDGQTEKLRFYIEGTSCDKGKPAGIEYTVPLTPCDYAAKQDLMDYFAGTGAWVNNKLGGNSAEPYDGTEIQNFTNGVVLSLFPS